MLRRISGKPKLEWFAKKASTPIATGTVMRPDGSGAIQPANASSEFHLGVAMKDVVATDADYAATTMIPVDFASPEDIFEADVATGTLTTAMVGNHYALNAAGTGIDVTNTAVKAVLVVGFISATKALVKLTAQAATAEAVDATA